MPDLLQDIEDQIAQAKTPPAKQNVGVIQDIGDGEVRCGRDPRFQNMMVQAIKWATGEVDGDATPSGEKK